MNEAFFQMIDLHTDSDGSFCAVIQLNTSHSLYEGHFPSYPITPGAIWFEIVREILEKLVQRPVFISKADNIKYLSLHRPQEGENIEIRGTIKDTKAQVQVMSANIIMSQFSLYL